MAVSLDQVVQVILIIGAINWGLVAIDGSDLVKVVAFKNEDIEKAIKLAVALAGIYAAYIMITGSTKK